MAQQNIWEITVAPPVACCALCPCNAVRVRVNLERDHSSADCVLVLRWPRSDQLTSATLDAGTRSAVVHSLDCTV